MGGRVEHLAHAEWHERMAGPEEEPKRAGNYCFQAGGATSLA